MPFERQLLGIAILLAACLDAMPARADIVSWTGGSNNDWFVSANWNPAQTPTNGDEVVITSGAVLLTNFTPYLTSFTIANATLTFANWSTKLSAGNVVISAGGTLTLPAAFTNNAMSNRVWIACSNITIASNGSINADGKGYARGTPTYSGQGPGGGGTGGNAGGGGGHGGGGSSGYNGGGGTTYGSTSGPLTPGSGGGGDSGYSTYGAHGGGAVLIEATGAVAVHGTISANGNSDGTGGRGGGGSGGSVYITCSTFAGTNGIIRANGGAGTSAGGAGGGGRIAVVYDTNAQASLPKPRVRFSADRAWGPYGYSGIGTIYFPDIALMDYGWMAHNGVLTVPNFTSWSVPSLLVTNGYMRIPSGNPFILTITNDLNIVGPTGILWAVNGAITCGGNIAVSGNGSALYLGSDSTLTNVQTLSCAGNIILSNNASMYVYSALTNAAQSDYGALVDVAGDISIATNSWIYPYSHNTNGGSALFRVNNMAIAAGGGINADGKGWRGGWYNVSGYSARGYGPGGGYDHYVGSGGGHGGRGGRSDWTSVRGAVYGSSNAPALPGSGGGARWYGTYSGAWGGGLVRIEAAHTLKVDGTINANGQNTTLNGGAGSGGGIYLRCLRFDGGTGGLLSANGGAGINGGAGAGAGGRIAVWRVPARHYYAGSFSVTNGTPSYTNDAESGTVVLVDIAEPGMMLMIR